MLVRGIAGVEYKDKVYFSTFYPVGCFFCFDLNDGTTKFIKQFHVEKEQGMYHRAAFLYRDTAWFIPWDGCRIACVNLESMEERHIDIMYHNFPSGHAFADYLVYRENELVLIPAGVNLTTLMIINMKTQETQGFESVIPEEKCIGAYIWEDILYFVSADGEALSEFDLIEKKIRFKKDSNMPASSNYSSVLQDDGLVYLIPYGVSEAVLIDLNNKRREKIPLPSEKNAYWSGCVIKDGILMCPGKYNSNFVRLDRFSKKGTVVEWDDESVSDDWLCIREISSDNQRHLLMGTDGRLYLFDEKGTLKRTWDYAAEADDGLQNPRIDIKISKRITTKYLLHNGLVGEHPGAELSDLISAVLDM